MQAVLNGLGRLGINQSGIQDTLISPYKRYHQKMALIIKGTEDESKKKKRSFMPEGV